jgi:type I restriction enzyme R subunit
LIFLRQGKKLEEKEKKEIKELSIELLEELKKEKLRVDQWADKMETSAAVFNYVNKKLFEILPFPIYQTDDIDLKTQMVYSHLKNQYYGGGVSVYGRY